MKPTAAVRQAAESLRSIYMDADYSLGAYMRRMRSALRCAIFSLSMSLIGS
jgi:hypothetical protein